MWKEINDNFDSNDVYFYFGTISYSGYDKLTRLIENKTKNRKEKCTLVLITYGGDPNYGYRIARSLGHYYPKGIEIFVPSVCKSAGTLIIIGSKEVIISDRGELGPLDIQLNNPEELLEMTSGMDLFQALQTISTTTLQTFKDYLFNLKHGGKLGTKISSEIASNLASSIIQPISAQIDPSRLGERQRALNIASSYGNSLNEKFKNTTEENIMKLISDYPSHGFVIDRKEASMLFKNVRKPNKNEDLIEKLLRQQLDKLNLRLLAEQDEPNIYSLAELAEDESNPKAEENEDEAKSNRHTTKKKVSKRTKRPNTKKAS